LELEVVEQPVSAKMPTLNKIAMMSELLLRDAFFMVVIGSLFGFRLLV